MRNYISIAIAALLLSAVSSAQTSTPRPTQPATRSAAGVVRGSIKDDTGGVIPGATVTLTDAQGKTRTATTGPDGNYTISGVAPGSYTVTSTYSGLATIKPATINVVPGQPAIANVVMTVEAKQQEITVTDSTTNQVSTDPGNNSSALVLQKEDLDALPDDPDDLQADLEALAGPSAGPGGTQVFVDGFTGGRLPPKESIREIRINSNPFSAEFDKLGYGRIQIFTKPGSDKFHGQSYYTISDNLWNSRNPFLSYNPDFRTQLFGGNVSGPLGKKASFFLDVERRNIDDNGIVTATIPTPDLLSFQSLQEAYATPQRRTTVSPRVDWQLGANNTLSFRYSYLDNDHQLAHIGAFDLPGLTLPAGSLPSNGYSQDSTDNSVQVVETAVLSPHTINETHYEFEQTNQYTKSSSTSPEVNVGQSFVVGGSGYSSVALPASLGYNTTAYPQSYDKESYNELQNYTTVTWGAHSTKFGFRIRASNLSNLTPTDFNGEYTFLGNGRGFPSISQFLDVANGVPGVLPSKFTIESGNPLVSFYQLDFGPFVQDDWKVRPNLTVSFGLRWEAQNNINDKNDWAPRFGFAWSPFARGNGGGRAKTVVRGGWGFFYDRFAASNVLDAYRSTQVQQYTLNNPTSYNLAFSPAGLPPLSELTQSTSQVYQIDNQLKAPRLMETVIGVDQQLAKRTTVSVNFLNSRGTHLLLTDDINAPGIVDGELGPRPYPNASDIYDYQSVGILKQTQVLVNVNSQVGKWLTIFSRYSYSDAHSNTDGLSTTPSNPYDISANWGRSSLSISHTFFMGGSFAAPWGLRFSPFIVARTGTPYDITTGTDIYGTGAVAPTARPSVVSAGYPDAVASPFGYLNPNPALGASTVERNLATGPGFIGLNLRVSKTFGFGSTSFKGNVGGTRANTGGGGFRGPGGPGMGEVSEHRYNVTLSLNARNILNHENLNTPNGAITSPYFLESTGISGGFGAESTASNQRRLDLQIRFAF